MKLLCITLWTVFAVWAGCLVYAEEVPPPPDAVPFGALASDSAPVLTIGTRVYVSMPMVDTNAYYTLWWTDSLSTTNIVWRRTGHNNIQPPIPCTNTYFEAVDAPALRFYKLTAETRTVEVITVAPVVATTNEINAIIYGGFPPAP